MRYVEVPQLPLWRIYLGLIAPLILASIYILPPFQSPDEVSHFYRAVQISHGDIKPMMVINSYRLAAGGAIDKSAVKFASKYCDSPSWLCPRVARPQLSEIVEEHAARAAGRQPAPFSNTVIYLPIAHAAPAVAIWIVREIGLGAAAWFYAGRLANALLSIGATSFALRCLRGSGIDLLVLVVATLPMTLSVAPTFSADACVISGSFVLLAVSVELIKNERARWLWPLLVVAILTAAVAKIAYLPLALMPIACVADQRARPLPIYAALFLASAIAVSWFLVVHGYALPISQDRRVDVTDQLTFVRANPVPTVRIVVASIAKEASDAVPMMIGYKLSGLTVLLPIALLIGSGLCLILGTMLGGSQHSGPAIRLAVLTAIGASVLLIFLFLYVQNTAVGSATVEGFQGRYLIPLLPFVGLAVPPWRRDRVEPLRRAVAGLSVLMAFSFTAFLALRSWA